MQNNFLSDDLQIIETTNFDAFDILHGKKDLDTNQQIVKPKEKEGEKLDDIDSRPKLTVAVLTDDMIDAGLSKAKELSKEPAGDEKEKEEPNDPAKGNPKEEAKKSDSANNAFKLHYEMMIEAGEWEPIEGFDGSEEKYLEARTKNDLARAEGIVDEYFEDAFKNNPSGREMGEKLFKHLQNGGSLKDFQDLYSADEIDYTALHSDDDDVAETAAAEIVRSYYTAANWKPEKIQTKIDKLKKSGTLIDEGKELEEPYKEFVTNQQKSYKQNIERKAELLKAEKKKVTDTLKELISANQVFGTAKLYENEKERKEIENRLFVKDDETGTTPFSADLGTALKNPKFLLFCELAIRKKLYEDPNSLIDSKSSESKATSKIQEKLENALLNKNIDTASSHSNSREKVNTKSQFSLDDAVVIS